jgi:riboflavin transporter FmnP
MKNDRTKKLVVIGVLSSVAAVLMFFDFPLWFAPDFYKLDFSEIPVLFGAFAYGPVAGVMIELVKIIVRTAITGTRTYGVGEFANFLIGISLVLPASLIYYRRKTKKRALIGLVVGTLSMASIGALLNAFVLLPAYAFFMSTPDNAVTVDMFVQMGTLVNPMITNVTTLILFAVTPFNILKGIVTSVVVLLIYKRLSMIIKSHDHLIEEKKQKSGETS